MYCKILLSWNLSDVFLIIRLQLWVGRDDRDKIQFITSFEEYIVPEWLNDCWCTLDHLGEAMLAGFSPVKLLSFPLLYCTLGSKSLHSSHWRQKELSFLLLEWSIYMNYSTWEIYLFSLIYSFIPSFIYVTMDSWIFILYLGL